MTMTREERIAELNQVAMEWECSFREALLETLFMLYMGVFPEDYLAQEWNCSFREALLEVLSMLYMDVFSEDYWEQELSIKTDEELLEIYLNW